MRDADGGWLYVPRLPPEAMPPVRKRDVELAWEAAHNAARDGRWGELRGFRFLRADGSHAEMLLADANAACWAAAVDRMLGLGNLTGMSLCLRLLALVDLMARARWLDGLHRMRHGAAELDVALLRLAAAAPLTRDGGFDAEYFRTRLFPRALAAPEAILQSQLQSFRPRA
jgi:hypothetical protein